MDDSVLIKELTQRGIIVTKDILERAKNQGIESVAGAPGRKPAARVSATIHRTEKKETMSVPEIREHYTRRFRALSALFRGRVSSVSISNAREADSGVSVIGMVREKLPHGYLLEDTTGEIEVVSKEAPAPDEVVAVTGRVMEGRLFSEEMLRPGVPEMGGRKQNLNMLLTTFLDEGIRKTLDGFDIVISPEGSGIEERSEKVISDVPSPGRVDIDSGGQRTSLLLYRPRREVSFDDVVSMLEARHLLPGINEISSVSDPFLIDPVPDVFWVISGERRVESHRGVMVVMSGERDAVKVDTGQRRAYFAYDTRKSPVPGK